MPQDSLDIIMKANSLTDFEIWDSACTLLKTNDLLPNTFEAYGKKISLTKAKNIVQKNGIFPRSTHYEINAGTVGNWDHQFLSIKSTNKDHSRIPWQTWVETFSPPNNFLMAWIADVGYNKWQNCEDIDVYKQFQIDYSDKKITPNYLYSPAPPKIIDITKNPGRRTIRKGIVEAVGSEMWLGPIFFERTGANKKQIMNIDWAEVEEADNGILHIITAETSFIDESTADIQLRLRKHLYPRTWNIPIRWKEWDGWKPVNLPATKDEDGYHIDTPEKKADETYPTTIEISGKKNGILGRFRLTRKSKEKADVDFIPKDD